MHLLAPAYIPSVSHSAILYLPHPRNPELLCVSQREKQSNHQNPVLTLGLEASYFLSSYLLDPQIVLVLRCSVMSLCNTMDYIACHAPESTGFTRKEYWSGVPGPPPGDLPNLDGTHVSYVSCIGRKILYR